MLMPVSSYTYTYTSLLICIVLASVASLMSVSSAVASPVASPVSSPVASPVGSPVASSPVVSPVVSPRLGSYVPTINPFASVLPRSPVLPSPPETASQIAEGVVGGLRREEEDRVVTPPLFSLPAPGSVVRLFWRDGFLESLSVDVDAA